MRRLLRAALLAGLLILSSAATALSFNPTHVWLVGPGTAAHGALGPLPLDFCRNLPGIQSALPPGYHFGTGPDGHLACLPD